MLCQSIFKFLDNGCAYQIAGRTLADVPTSKRKAVYDQPGAPSAKKARHAYGKAKLRKPHDIVIVRARLFFARPTLHSNGRVVFGLKHIHILNRLKVKRADSGSSLMADIFPLQHGLHNVFSSDVNRKLTVQPFRDYTVRDGVVRVSLKHRTPKCLRKFLPMAHNFMARHAHCSYYSLLNHHCPIKVEGQVNPNALEQFARMERPVTQRFSSSKDTSLATLVEEKTQQRRQEIFTDFATTPNSVSSFVSAVLQRVIPEGLLDTQNIRTLCGHVKQFIALRRYESLTLQHFMSGIKMKSVSWLDQNGSLSKSEKNMEIVAELIYWLVDSFIIPLVKSHFYVTETNMFRNRVFYFRHDVWRRLTEPEISRLRLTMLHEIPSEQASKILQERILGFAYLRLLPKGAGARPITNLRRRETTKDGTRHTRQPFLLPSINSVLQGVHAALTHEARARSNSTGFAVQSLDDIHDRLKLFKQRLQAEGILPKLYFAKVDVKSCFDTIDQTKVLDIASDLLQEDEYVVNRFCALTPSAGTTGKRFVTQAVPLDAFESFDDFANTYTKRKTNVLLVDSVVSRFRERSELVSLLAEHLSMHLIKIGQKFYRQDTGVPQGSILSSILCNCYYGDLEAKHLDFIDDSDGVCFRLIDDFLYITPDREKASMFLQVMHEGNPEYGCFVNSSKSLANFDCITFNERVPLHAADEFPVRFFWWPR